MKTYVHDGVTYVEPHDAADCSAVANALAHVIRTN